MLNNTNYLFVYVWFDFILATIARVSTELSISRLGFSLVDFEILICYRLLPSGVIKNSD